MEIMSKCVRSSIAMAVALASQTLMAQVAVDPQGIDLEPFLFVPTLEVGLRHDSNIYNLPSSQEVDSMVMTIAPTLRLLAQDRANSYYVQYGMVAGLYFEDSDDNFIDHNLSVGAQFEPTSRVRFGVNGGYAMLHDDRGTGASEGGGLAGVLALSEPDQYKRTSLGANLEYGAQDAVGQLVAGLGFAQKRYDRAAAAQSRDLDTLDLNLGLRMRLMPKTKMLFDIERQQGRYEDAATSASADYDDTRLLVGLTWEATGKTTGRVRVGTSDRELPNRDVSAFTWDAGVTWSPREHYRFTFDGGQRTTDGTFPTLAIENTYYTVGWNHDWTPRVESRLAYTLSTDDHERATGFGTREDDTSTIAANLNYQMRRWLVFGASVSLRTRDSTAAGFDYDRNVIALNALISL